MEWYYYLWAFFSGACFGNAVPHFIHGVSGDKFPTPFSKPRGVGLSSSTTNVVWALFNLVVGWLLLRAGRVQSDNPWSMLALFAGVAAISIPSSINFRRKHKD